MSTDTDDDISNQPWVKNRPKADAPKAKPEAPKPEAKAPKTKPKAPEKAPTKAPSKAKGAAKPEAPKPEAKGKAKGKTDQYGYREGSLKSKAAHLYATGKGATLAEVKSALGSVQLNVLTELKNKGYEVETSKVDGSGSRQHTRYKLLPKA